MSKSLLLEIPPDLVHSRIPMLHLHYTGERNQKIPMMALFVFFLLSSTVQLEDVSLHHDLLYNRRVRNLRVLVLL